MADSILDRVRAEVALIREDLSAANLAGDLSKARALVNSALRRVEGVIGSLAGEIEAEIEKIEAVVTPDPPAPEPDETPDED